MEDVCPVCSYTMLRCVCQRNENALVSQTRMLLIDSGQEDQEVEATFREMLEDEILDSAEVVLDDAKR